MQTFYESVYDLVLRLARAKQARRKEIRDAYAEPPKIAERRRARDATRHRARRSAMRLLLGKRAYLKRPAPPDYIEVAKRRVAADPMRHWISPPCN